MTFSKQHSGKTIGVLGLGKTGLSVIGWAKMSGVNTYAWDESPSGQVGFQAYLDALKSTETEIVSVFDAYENWPWDTIDFLVVSPGVPLTHPFVHGCIGMAQDKGIPYIGDIDLFFNEVQSSPLFHPSFMGITGTNGKSTTTALTAHLLSSSGTDAVACGNIGRAVLDLLPEYGFSYGGGAKAKSEKPIKPVPDVLKEDMVFVTELSSYQLDLCQTFAPRAGIFLNLTPDHLDRHGDMEGYFKAKCRLFQNMTDNDVAVICVDDEYGQRLYQLLCDKRTNGHHAPEIWAVATEPSAELADKIPLKAWTTDHILYESGAFIADLRSCHGLEGRHNAQNAVCAYTACRSVGLSVTDLVRGLETFKPLPHRMETVALSGQRRYINDSKATNADSAEKSLSTFDTIYWIAGGQAKAGGITPLVPYFGRVKKAYLIGEAAIGFYETLHQNGVDCVITQTLDKAVEESTKDCIKNGNKGVILLSPACASWDQFKSYEHRGDVFRALSEKASEK